MQERVQEKIEPSYNVVGNVNWYSHYTERHVYDPVIPFLGTYPEQILIKKDIHTHPYVHSIFTIAKTWKQPNVH